ncbi:GRAM domain-containing protein, partial [Diplocarpon rosae]
MSFPIDQSESPPKNGLTQLFSKTRRDRKGRDSTGNSLKRSSSDTRRVRASVEGTIDRLKGHEVTEEDADPSGIKKLVPKALGSKRRKKQLAREEAERVARANSPPLDGPPPLTSHSSHIGYLTTSSPLVQTVTLPDSSLSDAQLDGLTPRASTFPTDTLAASVITPGLETTLQASADGSEKRSPSPVGRIKQAFTPRRGSTPNTSPERKPGGGLGISKEKTAGTRRGNVALRIGSIFPDRQLAQESSSPERPRTAKNQTTNATEAPHTPPPGEETAPKIVNTPPTPTDSDSPRFGPSRGSEPITANANIVVSPTGNMISHRRIRSGSATLVPSKLSNITAAPLTPTPENGATTPGGGGFFSSVFSAAQNAASTLSNSIGNQSAAAGNRSKSGTQDTAEIESPIVETFADKTDSEAPSEEKELAVKTLGMGDLSLSALGISETSSGINTPVGLRFPEDARGRTESTNGDSRSEYADNVSTTATDDIQPLFRPRSMYEPGTGGDLTPPNGSVFEGRAGLQRSGSIRSAIGNHRKRGSSAANGTTIGAAIVAANSSLVNPAGGTPKITGFAVASKKRNRDFHQLFRSVPDDDYLIEDYSCALQREILAHGRLYVSEGHLCFSSNIFGWVTTLVMSFDEIVSVEKRSTALLFKNGLMISTLHAKNIFASFTSRDSTYDLIVGIWKLGHPSLQSSLNGVRIEETGGGDKTEKDDGTLAPESHSGSDSDSGVGEEGEDIYDEDEEDEDGISISQAEGSVVGSEPAERVVSRKPSAAVVTGAQTEKKDDGSGSPPDFPGPVTHVATECGDQETHYAKVIGDEVVQAPLGKIYSLMFGPASVTWMRNWLTVEQKCLEMKFEDSSKKPLSLENKVRHYSYIKPLNGSIGPKQTKCVCTETLESFDLEKSVSVLISTQTPDVPSGNVFSTKTKYCLSWAEGNATRIQMNCAIEWTGKSWLKGPIEKGANDGQVQYAKDIIASLKTAVSTRRGIVPTVAGKGKKKGRKGRESKSISKTTDGASDSKPSAETWGLFEPLHGILGPISDIFSPLLSGNILYGLVVGLLVASWFRFGFSSRGSNSTRDHGMAYFGTSDRTAAYEEIWRREESELWEWLEDRVGMDWIRDAARMPIESRKMQNRLNDERMDDREVEAAIRVTEEKLRVLKATVEKRK